ncbi:galactose mutarotase-like enzyme [Mucilaginibacter gracilis]|uniref:Galactose mutarotase-like enzyme n=1 Tax=Mucilaginibacter gracilis TaxID=423350 RepID=A0A495J8T1_9SPHI|nr:aldose 1-epimerase family protein [Mucilaginibacter gracilis]RKR85091.1 galactose mutarotase-like enzyme [Mucilaginibacter gracilis]
MTTIENKYLKVSIRPQGAELTSVYNKTDNTEHLWQADEAIWPWHAPNLFPLVGGTMNNELHVDGVAYPATRHGFTRTSTFQLVEASDKHAKFSLPYSEKTLAIYPYKFELQIIYTLIDNALRVCYKVVNQDEHTIYFSVGGHPAFNVPFYAGEKYEDYYLEFEQEEELLTHTISPDGNLSGDTEAVNLDGKKLRLTKELFANDALVFKNIKSREIAIRSDKHDKFLTVQYPHFKHMGIWAKYGADFLCIEPWLGYSDTEGIITDIKQKEAIQHVDHGHVFEAEFFIITSY